MANPALRAVLVRIDARLADGTVVSVRLSNVNEPEVCHLDDMQWDPALLRAPVLSYDFFGGAFQNAIALPQAQFAAWVPAMAQVPVELLARLRFAGAPVQIWTGDAGAPWSGYVLRFAGRIVAEPEIEDMAASFSAAPDDAWLDDPLLELYAGTGGLEGPEDLTGTAKPLVLGEARFVPGVPIDPVDLVYQVSAYGPVQAITAAYDRLVSLGPATGDHADLAALLAASIPDGRWATCLAHGLVRLGWPADGKLCFDVLGDAGAPVGRAGGMIARVAALAGGETTPPNIARLDAARPWDQCRVLAEQTTARQVIQELSDSVAAVAGISWTGKFFVQPFGFDDLATGTEVTLDARGTSEPVVAGVSQQPVDPPFWRLATNAALTWQVHDLAEIASEYILRGQYSAARAYRLDDLVFAEDGRAFLFINATPGAGHALPVLPATSNSYWEQQASGSDWSQVVGSGKPEDNATLGAPSGTSVAGRDADTVADTIKSSGEINDEKVVSDSVVDGAITTRARAYTAGSVTLASGSFGTWYETQRVTVTVSPEGEEVDIDAEFRWIVSDNCRVMERWKRDATVLDTTPEYGLNSSDNPRGGYGYTDNPGPGTYDFIHEVATNDGGDVAASRRRVRCLGPIR